MAGETSPLTTVRPPMLISCQLPLLSSPRFTRHPRAAGAEGGKRLGDVHNGEWVHFHPVSLKGITGLKARVSSDKSGNVATFRYDSITGPQVARVTVPNTGGWEITVPVTNAVDGTRDLYVVFTGGAGAILDLDSYTFTGPGIDRKSVV